MSESPTTINNFSEEEAATLILVDVNDSPLGSVSLTERLVIEEKSAEPLIHRTCSLHIFWNGNPAGNGNPTSRMLLSKLLPQSASGDEYCDSSQVRFLSNAKLTIVPFISIFILKHLLTLSTIDVV